VSVDRPEPGRLLSLERAAPSYPGGDGTARPDAEGCAGIPAYGYRRITAELQQRGFEVNHKRVLRMMREDNLLCVRRRAFVATTIRGTSCQSTRTWPPDNAHGGRRHLHSTAHRVRVLAVVLDAFSRRVIGWALGRTLQAELAVAALRMALIDRQPSPGLVHHSDRGVQYA